jgi:hypothetical protein
MRNDKGTEGNFNLKRPPYFFREKRCEICCERIRHGETKKNNKTPKQLFLVKKKSETR